MTTDTQRRFGTFRISGRLVAQADPAVTRIMGMCAVMRAEHLLMVDQVEYAAISHRFRHVPPGEIAPAYEWVMNEDGSVDCNEIARPGF